MMRVMRLEKMAPVRTEDADENGVEDEDGYTEEGEDGENYDSTKETEVDGGTIIS